MIPYFTATTIPFWPLPIRVWGLLVALGILAATAVAWREAKRRGLDGEEMLDFVAVTVIAGAIGARVGFLLFYAGGETWLDPWSAFRVWEGGMSLFGAVLGVAVALLILRRRLGGSLWSYAEAAAFAYPLGEGIGRLGCFLIHDHPGIRTNFFLAVAFPDGPRLDHGLLLSLAFLLVFLLFLLLNRRRPPPPFFLPWLLVLWGGLRFGLDFLRASDLPGSDARYWGLTPAQYGGFLMLVAGAVWLTRRRRARNQIKPAAPPA